MTEPRAGVPDPDACTATEHVGRLHHDGENDIWYECVFDARNKVFTWSALPPVEGTVRALTPTDRSAGS